MENHVLVTGGAGYVGSHTVVALLESGYKVIVLDNFSNSQEAAIDGVERICGQRPDLIRGDTGDPELLKSIFMDYEISSVFHFSGLKSVEESFEKPLRYYKQNIGASLTLLEAMREAQVQNIVFSSSATVYDPLKEQPYSEESPTGPVNPYGQTKLLIEQVLIDLAKISANLKVAILRYFNPVGAHPSGHIGEDPKQKPNNLMPLIMQTAIGKRNKLEIYGEDYDTPDGSCIRDYIHVLDLARGHLAALSYLSKNSGSHVWNLGTGIGTSVLELVDLAKRITGIEIVTEIAPRRLGDSPIAVANPQKARNELSWNPEYSLENMCVDHWNWQRNHPDGYQ